MAGGNGDGSGGVGQVDKLKGKRLCLRFSSADVSGSVQMTNGTSTNVKVSKKLGEGGSAFVYLVKRTGGGDMGESISPSHGPGSGIAKTLSLESTSLHSLSGASNLICSKKLVLKVSSVDTPERIEQSLNEASMLRRFGSHPNIVSFLGSGFFGSGGDSSDGDYQHNSQPYGNVHWLLIEYCPGGSLLDLILSLRRQRDAGATKRRGQRRRESRKENDCCVESSFPSSAISALPSPSSGAASAAAMMLKRPFRRARSTTAVPISNTSSGHGGLGGGPGLNGGCVSSQQQKQQQSTCPPLAGSSQQHQEHMLELQDIVAIFLQVSSALQFLHNRLVPDDNMDEDDERHHGGSTTLGGDRRIGETSHGSAENGNSGPGWSDHEQRHPRRRRSQYRRSPIIHFDIKPENILLVHPPSVAAGSGVSGVGGGVGGHHSQPASSPRHSGLPPELFQYGSGGAAFGGNYQERWRCKLCDFGSAREGRVPLRTPDERRGAGDVIRRTTTQMYRSPEMVDLYVAQEVTEKADVWSLGCSLYNVAFLRNCFEPENSNLAILAAKYEVPREHSYPDDLVDLINRMLVVDAKERPSVGDVINCLHALQLGQKLPETSQQHVKQAPACVPSDDRDAREEKTTEKLKSEHDGGGTGSKTRCSAIRNEKAGSALGVSVKSPLMREQGMVRCSSEPISPTRRRGALQTGSQRSTSTITGRAKSASERGFRDHRKRSSNGTLDDVGRNRGYNVAQLATEQTKQLQPDSVAARRILGSIAKKPDPFSDLAARSQATAKKGGWATFFPSCGSDEFLNIRTWSSGEGASTGLLHGVTGTSFGSIHKGNDFFADANDRTVATENSESESSADLKGRNGFDPFFNTGESYLGVGGSEEDEPDDIDYFLSEDSTTATIETDAMSPVSNKVCFKESLLRRYNSEIIRSENERGGACVLSSSHSQDGVEVTFASPTNLRAQHYFPFEADDDILSEV